jgi:hypothetical protein
MATTEERSESKNLSEPGKNASFGGMRDKKWLPPTAEEIPQFWQSEIACFALLRMTYC